MEAVAWIPHNGWRRQGVMCKILVSSSIGHGVLIDLNTVTGGGLMTNTEFTNDSLMAWLAMNVSLMSRSVAMSAAWLLIVHLVDQASCASQVDSCNKNTGTKLGCPQSRFSSGTE